MALNILPFTSDEVFSMNSFNNKIEEINTDYNNETTTLTQNVTQQLNTNTETCTQQYQQMQQTVDNAVANAISVPIGGIIMWSGAASTIPSNYHICDGTNGTPNLTNNFIVAAGGTYALGATGGEATHTLTVNEMPNHSHEIKKGVSGSGQAPGTLLSYSGGIFNTVMGILIVLIKCLMGYRN